MVAGCSLLDAMMPASTEYARSRVSGSTKTTIRCACARTRVPDSPSTDLVVDSGSTWTRWEVVRMRTRHGGITTGIATITERLDDEREEEGVVYGTGDSEEIARVRSVRMGLEGVRWYILAGRYADVTLG